MRNYTDKPQILNLKAVTTMEQNQKLLMTKAA